MQKDVRLERFAASHSGHAVSFFWGVCEATVFFIVPDVFLGLMALFAPLRILYHCAASIIGAMVGGSVMYMLANNHPEAIFSFLDKIPGISMQMISAVRQDFATHGMWALLIAPWKGIPYKIFAAQAGSLNLDFFYFLLISIPARLERFVLVCVVATLLGLLFKANIKRNKNQWLIGYCFFWGVSYLLYYLFLTTQH